MIPLEVRGRSKIYQVLNIPTEIPGKKAIPSLLEACNKFGKILEYNERNSYIIMKVPGRSDLSFRSNLIMINVFISESHILLKFFAVARSLMVEEGELVDIIESISKEMISIYSKKRN